jgi:hypothetical protein
MTIKDPTKYDEWRKKISESTKKAMARPEVKAKITGINNHNFGKHPSKETLKKLSEVRLGKKRKPFSEEWKKKLSEAHLGKKQSEEHRKHIGDGHRGKHHPPEWCENISKAQRGEKSWNWQGGKSFEPYCEKFNKEFKERVRAFFGYKCVECGKNTEDNGKALAVHHINYDKMVCCNDVKPLFVALCCSHNNTANFNREMWEQHYTNLINEKYGGLCYLPKGCEA